MGLPLAPHTALQARQARHRCKGRSTGLPRDYRHMHGFGGHTFSFIDTDDRRCWVKFTLRSEQGIKNLTDEEAVELVGCDRESAQRDLYEAIEPGNYPPWTMFVQVMTEAQAAAHPQGWAYRPAARGSETPSFGQ